MPIVAFRNKGSYSPDKPKEKKKNKNKHKVTFVDKLGTSEAKDLVSVVFVLSQKKYNALNTFDGPFDNEPEESESACCTLF